jgi:hypothetical protein
MSDTPAMNPRQLSSKEVEDFRALGLTPGHWGALAAVPLVRQDFRLPDRTEIKRLHEFCIIYYAPIIEWQGEAEQFWSRYCQKQLGSNGAEICYALLGWHLARDFARSRREDYIRGVDRCLDPHRLRYGQSGKNPVIRTIRSWIEAYLPMAAYERHPEVRIPPPTAAEAALLFGADLWKQTLAAPIAAALAARNARPAEVMDNVRRLSRVTESPTAPNFPLETQLAPGWRQLFSGLLRNDTRAEMKRLIEEWMQVAARGLASMTSGEREHIYEGLADELKIAVGWEGYPDIRERTRAVEEWLNSLREKVEGVLIAARPSDVPNEKPAVGTRPEPTAAEPRAANPMSEPKPDGPGPTPARVPEAVPPALPPFRQTSVAVEVAHNFSTVKWEEAIARARATPFATVRAWLQGPSGMLFDEFRQECPDVAIVRDPKAVPQVLWIIGDIHADVLTLANVIEHAERVGQAEGVPPSYLFLGDFVDRGRHDHDTLLLLFRLILDNPGRVCVIPGNHDIDLQWDEKPGRFRVSIEPAEYCERLNTLIRNGSGPSDEQIELARLLIPFWQGRPKAVVLPDGTMFSHGGFPHTDTHQLLKTPADLARQPCVNDFLWARLSESARKRPNRGNRGHEFGWDNFAQFCKVTAQMGIPPVKRLVRGHDHVASRWQYCAEYVDHPVLTINAMGWRMESEPDPAQGPHPFPVMARHQPNQLPLVVRLPLDHVEVDRGLGKEPAPSAASGIAQKGPCDPPNATPGHEETFATGSRGSATHASEYPGGILLDPLNNLLPEQSNASRPDERRAPLPDGRNPEGPG